VVFAMAAILPAIPALLPFVPRVYTTLITRM
jgi:hypothetical protein